MMYFYVSFHCGNNSPLNRVYYLAVVSNVRFFGFLVVVVVVVVVIDF
jgi:hypothetical protein